ncbi:MAG TPA: hypothetical protein VHW60_20925 [Caulobacteraceae bacterium]|jgi:hypothetical protein|nr:hypothetical protein [Caulobacteraceae bacterium]
MLKSQLELRSPPWIVLAYLVSPFCGLNAWLALGFAFDPPSPGSIAEGWLIVMVVGGLASLLVEVVVVTPILMGFHAFRWRWLNGWSAAAIGFALAVAAWFACGHLFPPEETDAPPDVWLLTPGLTLPGWMHTAAMQATEAIWYGVVGLVGATVFRLVAVRPHPPLIDWLWREVRARTGDGLP